jgi:SNF2 family DNA or RNA helicase
MPATNLWDQRQERKRTLTARCERAAQLVNDTGEPALVWCHMNDEGNLLKDLIPDAVQVSGSDSDNKKEEKFTAFTSGAARVLITKPVIGAWGLNFQHCAHIVYFPSHSYEQYYQSVRRCWRFGQQNPVKVDLILTEGERRVMENLSRKSSGADRMFQQLVECMNNSLSIKKSNDFSNTLEVPTWL